MPATRPDHVGRLHLDITDDPARPADTRIYLGLPAHAVISVRQIESDRCTALLVEGDHGLARVIPLLLGAPPVRVRPDLALRLLAGARRRGRWVSIELTAPGDLPIWRGRVYPRVLADYRAALDAQHGRAQVVAHG